MDGMTQGFIDRVGVGLEDEPLEMRRKYGVRLINYIADVWDYVEKFKAEVGETKATTPSRPTCSVLIKHLPQKQELYVGHNAWHEYSAMGYRFQKKDTISTIEFFQEVMFSSRDTLQLCPVTP